MKVILTPGTATAGGTRIFVVLGAHYDTTNGELTLTCRDGRICLGLHGSWEMAVERSLLQAMSCDEAERIHDERSLIQTVN
jgi:hypothetical protein